jgi:hypothetical protein
MLLVQACSSDSGGVTQATTDASTDAASQGVDGGTSPQQDSGSAGTDAGTGAVDSGDAGACPATWTAAPVVDPTIAVPDGGGGVLMHAEAVGTQDYTCTAQATDAGTTYAWVFVGPEAVLSDCHATVVGHHFASDAGASAPEWMTLDNAYVIGAKKAAFTPDGGATSIPWLLVQETSTGGTGPITKTLWVNRLSTDGGVAPAATCDLSNAGTTQKVAYTADYYFYGN